MGNGKVELMRLRRKKYGKLKNRAMKDLCHYYRNYHKIFSLEKIIKYYGVATQYMIYGEEDAH